MSKARISRRGFMGMTTAATAAGVAAAVAQAPQPVVAEIYPQA